MSFEPKLPEPRTPAETETELSSATDLLSQNLARARAGLGELEAGLAPMGDAAETVAQVARQLSDMVLSTATEITRSGPAGRAFMPLVEQLAAAARTSLTAAHALRRATSDTRTRTRTVTTLAERSQATLDRLGPAIGALASAAAQAARTRGPAVEVVAPSLAFTSAKAARVAQLTDEVLRMKGQRSSGPKN